MCEPILVLNAGSSSLKFSVFETTTDRSLKGSIHGEVEDISGSANLTVVDAHGHKVEDWLGLAFDAAANEAEGPRISTAGSKVSAWVIPTDENLMIARHTRHLLDS